MTMIDRQALNFAVPATVRLGFLADRARTILGRDHRVVIGVAQTIASQPLGSIVGSRLLRVRLVVGALVSIDLGSTLFAPRSAFRRIPLVGDGATLIGVGLVPRLGICNQLLAVLQVVRSHVGRAVGAVLEWHDPIINPASAA